MDEGIVGTETNNSPILLRGLARGRNFEELIARNLTYLQNVMYFFNVGTLSGDEARLRSQQVADESANLGAFSMET